MMCTTCFGHAFKDNVFIDFKVLFYYTEENYLFCDAEFLDDKLIRVIKLCI